MSIKTLANAVTGKVARQALTVKTHSPVMLFGLGIAGVTTTAVLACRATLKLSSVLETAEDALKLVEDNKVAPVGEEPTEEFKRKASFGVKLTVAIKVAKLYAPAVAVGLLSVGALTGSHIILNRRNAGLTAAFAIADKTLKDYRERVVNDQGAEKDFEYRWGVAEREVVEEGPNGPETRVLKGLDQEAISELDEEFTYARLFGPEHDDWSDVPHQNQSFVASMQSHANTLLRVNGFVFLNDVYDLLGYKKTKAGQVVGWVVNPAEGKGDGYIDFGVWNDGVYQGKEWINGHKESILLDFNVDGNVLDLMPDA